MWIKAIEKIFQTALIRYIRQINQLLQFLLKSVPEEPVVNPGDSGDINTCDAEELHLLWVEPALCQLVATLEPFVTGFALLESYVSTSLQFS